LEKALRPKINYTVKPSEAFGKQPIESRAGSTFLTRLIMRLRDVAEEGEAKLAIAGIIAPIEPYAELNLPPRLQVHALFAEVRGNGGDSLRLFPVSSEHSYRGPVFTRRWNYVSHDDMVTEGIPYLRAAMANAVRDWWHGSRYHESSLLKEGGYLN
jgi:hypothetical protein